MITGEAGKCDRESLQEEYHCSDMLSYDLSIFGILASAEHLTLHTEDRRSQESRLESGFLQRHYQRLLDIAFQTVRLWLELYGLKNITRRGFNLC